MSTAEIFYTLIGSMIIGALVFMVGLGMYVRHKMKNPPPSDGPDSD